MEKSEEGRKREKMKRKILIVGGVAGGASAAAKARRIDETQEIIIFEKGQHISFASCGLPYYISDEIKYQRDLLVWTPESFARFFNVDTKTGHEVLKIYPQRKEIEVKELKTERVYHEKYDKLILAPGTVPYVPECFRIDFQNVKK